jgi:hypothetical protein
MNSIKELTSNIELSTFNFEGREEEFSHGFHGLHGKKEKTRKFTTKLTESTKKK